MSILCTYIQYTLIQSCFVAHCLWLTHSQAHTFLHCTITPLWYHYASREALGAAWQSFYQILGPFKWMILWLWRDQQTKSPLFLSSRLLSSRSCSLILVWKHSCSHLLHHLQKKVFFPRIPCRATSWSPFLGPPEGTGSLVVPSHHQRPTAVSFLFVLG